MRNGIFVRITRKLRTLEIFFSKNASNLRGHSMKVTKKSFKLDVHKFSFTNRVINEWNGLSEEIIQSKSLAGFKKRIIISDTSHDLYKLHFWASFLLFVEIIIIIVVITHRYQVQVQVYISEWAAQHLILSSHYQPVESWPF